jgi:cytochrome c oxidase assembly factor CtaG
VKECYGHPFTDFGTDYKTASKASILNQEDCPGFSSFVVAIAGRVGITLTITGRKLMGLYTILEIGLLGLLYARITRLVWRKAGLYAGISKAQTIAFFVGLLALLAACVGPVDTLSDRYYSAHMLRSLLLALAAPPLLVAGLPGDALRLALPGGSLGRWGRIFRVYPNMKKMLHFLTQPIPAWGLHAAALGLWLQPQAYLLTRQSEFIQSAAQTNLFVAGLFFWVSFMRLAGLAGARGPRRLTDALLSAATLGLFAAMLGVLIVVTPQPQPGVIAIASRLGTLPALDDRKLAGVLLLLLAGGAYMAAIWTTVRYSSHAENDSEPAPDYVAAEREY